MTDNFVAFVGLVERMGCTLQIRDVPGAQDWWAGGAVRYCAQATAAAGVGKERGRSRRLHCRGVRIAEYEWRLKEVRERAVAPGSRAVLRVGPRFA